MENDEQAIRNLISRWMEATKAGDLETVLGLMSDGVVFMVPGRAPFGKEAFAASSRQMKDLRIESVSDIVELQILRDWAWLRNHIKVNVTFPDGKVIKRAGYTLTILQKNLDGAWVLVRDANLLTAVE